MNWISDDAHDGVVKDAHGAVFARWRAGNVLEPGWTLPDGPGLVIAWSGSVGEDLFESDVRTWGPSGQARFHARCDELAAELSHRGQRLVFRPHARHALSDPHRVQQFLIRRAGGPFGVVIDPGCFFTPGMLTMAEDHVERIFAVLGPMAGVVGVVMSNANLPGGTDADGPDAGAAMQRVGLSSGAIKAEWIVNAWRRHVPASLPVMGIPGDRGLEAASE